MPSVVKNQSQLRVPPMPWITALFLSANGNCNPELMTALLLPAAGLPITMYHGSSYSAEPPDTWPIFEVLIVFTVSARRVRSTSRSARFAGSATAADILPVSACCSSMSPSWRFARRTRQRRQSFVASQSASATPSATAAHARPIWSASAAMNRTAASAAKPTIVSVRG